MATPFTFDDWKAIVDRVNALSCVGTHLPEPTSPKRWSVADIVSVRNKLAAICANHPTFSAATVKWTQAVIDELNTAITNCQCCNLAGDVGVQITAAVSVELKNMFQSGGMYYWQIWLNLSDLNGLQLGASGMSYRSATAVCTTTYDTLAPYTTGLGVNCNGTLLVGSYESQVQYPYGNASSDTEDPPEVDFSATVTMIHNVGGTTTCVTC